MAVAVGLNPDVMAGYRRDLALVTWSACWASFVKPVRTPTVPYSIA